MTSVEPGHRASPPSYLRKDSPSPSAPGRERGPASEVWRLIYQPPGLAADLLAGSERLLASVGAGATPALRWYVTLRPALVLGVGQPVSEIDVDACARAGIPVVRRSSGGAAVLADDGLLNLDVVLPAGHRLGSRDVVQAYAWLGAGLARSLGCLGWAARTVAPDEARRDTTALRAATNPRETTLHRTCFGGRSPHEVLVDERKVVGLCQVRRRAGTLYQIGILLQFDAARIAGLLSGPSAERSRGATQLGRRASGLQTLPLEHAELDRDVRGAVTTARQTGMQRVLDGVSPNHRASAGEIILGVERAIATIAMATYRLAEPCPATTIDERQLDG